MKRWITLTRIILAGLAVLFLALGVGELVQYKNSCRRLLENHSAKLQMEYSTILTCCRNQANLIFNEAINRDFVLNEVHSGLHAGDEISRTKHRNRLHAHLEPTYENAKKAMFRQLHFHFPDCTSFLRMHRPAKFGDSLTGVRPTVLAANRDKKFISGFEEGRVFNGYRYVFPLAYESEHIGTAEISVSFAAIGSILREQLAIRNKFVLPKDIIDSKVFPSEMDNYSNWPCNDKYLLDVEASDSTLFPGHQRPAAYQKLHREIEKKMGGQKDFSWIVRDHGKAFILQFMAIENFLGQHAAYWISVQEEPDLIFKKRHLQITLLLLLFLFLLCTVSIIWVNRVLRRLQEDQNFLLICATCKQVRGLGTNSRDPKAWISIEEYFDSSTHPKLTHGICPSCYKKSMEEYDD